jgi:hypothetical protein
MRISAAGVFVGATWVALFAAAVYFVARFAGADPFGDEWDLMSGITYQEPYLKWLWAQHNEHRLPLPKLVYTWLLNVYGFDARAGGFATVGILGAVSMAFIFAARRLRGVTEYADAFFPIAFLNWGHFENYLIGFQVGFAMSVALACVWLLSALSWCERRQPVSLKWMGIALVLLPLCGAHGLVYAPPLGLAALWLARSAPRFARVYIALTVAASWVITAAYFRNYASPEEHPHSAGVVASSRIALEVLSLGWGWVGQMTWPASGLLMATFVFATAVLILVSVRVQPEDRERLLAFAAVAAGTITLALGIGWGRSGFGPLAGFAVRYGILMLPLMAAGYLVWVRNGGRLCGSLVPMAMFTMSCLFLTQHCRTGLAEGRESAAAMTAFADDLRAGMSPDELARKHPKLYPHADRFAARIRVLQSGEIPRYAPAMSRAFR